MHLLLLLGLPDRGEVIAFFRPVVVNNGGQELQFLHRIVGVDQVDLSVALALPHRALMARGVDHEPTFLQNILHLIVRVVADRSLLVSSGAQLLL